jgi:hypothetical protein
MRPGRVEVSIDEVVLIGFPPTDRHVLADALQARLADLLSGSDREWAAGDIPAADGGSFPVPQGASPESIGAAVARAICASGPR